MSPPRHQGMDLAIADAVTGAEVDFDDWVASRATALTRFAYLVTGNQHDADEAVQSALTSACAAWSRVQAADDPDAYVRRMILNAHTSWWRRFRQRETPVAEIANVTPGVGGPPDAVVGHAEADRIWRLCGLLPPQQRAAVVLRYYEDLDFAAIAVILDCAESTARVHVHKALRTLRARLEEERGDG